MSEETQEGRSMLGEKFRVLLIEELHLHASFSIILTVVRYKRLTL
jgi:hypothetical protein